MLFAVDLGSFSIFFPRPDWKYSSLEGEVVLRYCIDELGWRARTSIEWKRAWPDEVIHVKFLWVGCRSQGALYE